MNDRPKTMAERTLRVVGGKIVPNAASVSDGAPALPDAAMAWTGTPLSTALANARAAEARPADAQGEGPLATAPGEDQDAADETGDAQPPEAAPAWSGAADAPGTDVRSGARALGADGQSGARTEGALGASGQSGARAEGALGQSGARGKRHTRLSGGASPKATHAFAASRAVARKLALQAIYRWLLNDAPWQDLVKEFGEAEDMPNADPQYFRALVEGVWDSRKSLDERLAELVDRPVEQLDPVEHAVLLVGLYELSARPDVPYRVAINEAVGLAKRFGATDGHKFVNAVMDRAARTLRPGEN
ncbi:MAG TPA: transcription antitermination factor NusB [Steroidobacteraceae bacterium]